MLTLYFILGALTGACVTIIGIVALALSLTSHKDRGGKKDGK